MESKRPENIEAYISAFPQGIQEILREVQSTIKNLVPDAEETISYGIPAFHLNGRYLIYFAAFKKHIGIYPIPANDEDFMRDFSGYKTGKGSVQFPYDKPLPWHLITKIVMFRLEENLGIADKKNFRNK